MPPRHIAVLGAGLTGLSSAFHLSRRFPAALITLVEKQKDVGGWVRSERVHLRDPHGTPATVVLEAGPRTLRPDARSILELINLLDLSKSVITTPTSAPAARSKFLHIPGTPGLVPIPTSLPRVLWSPLRRTLLAPVLREAFRSANRPSNISDESFDSFITRRFGVTFARTFGSALVHGIYAADSRKLSIRAAFPSLWDAEERSTGSVVCGLARAVKRDAKDDYALGNTLELMNDVSVFSFQDGLATITTALERYLTAQPNIRILRNTSITSINSNSLEILVSNAEPLIPSHIVSTLALPTLHSLLPTSHSLPHLTVNPYSSVTVANFVFPVPPSQIHPIGFGYLVPRPADDYASAPASQSGGILGTIFDSCSLGEQDSSTNLTKLTVMLGGPYYSTVDPTPSPDLGPTTLRHLQAHLNLPQPLPDPIFSRISHNIRCIPTLMPGHLERMDEMKNALLQGSWGGRLEVVGAGVGGVSVGDCIEAGKRVGARW